ncbi:MAG: hypothetical protein K0S68_464 [Candidatus Saccharibacteria bacterium]|jgi:uncharacterized membrane protein YdjX (TVP38/TMEM64 family)|nr:hypothetical protein [Candidatus Saccharibacteria bacterium]
MSDTEKPKAAVTAEKNKAPELPSWEKFAPALLVVVIISVLTVWAMNALGGVDKVRGFVEGTGVWAPVTFILLKAATYVFAPLSGTPMKITAGALFGVWDGLLYLTIGDLLGGSLNFWIARIFGRPLIGRLAGEKSLKKVDDTAAHVGGWKALLIARLVLSPLYDFISYAAGLSNLKFKHYVWVTLVGGIPAALMFAWFGDALTQGPTGIWILLGAAALVGLSMVLQKWAAKAEVPGSDAKK